MSAHTLACNSQNIINDLWISTQMLLFVIVFMGIFLSSSIYFFILVLGFSLSLRRVLEEAPLMTQSLRETQKKEKLDKYPKVSLLHVHANILILDLLPM